MTTYHYESVAGLRCTIDFPPELVAPEKIVIGYADNPVTYRRVEPPENDLTASAERVVVAAEQLVRKHSEWNSSLAVTVAALAILVRDLSVRIDEQES